MVRRPGHSYAFADARKLNEILDDIVGTMCSEIEDYLVRIMGDGHPCIGDIALVQAYIRAQIDDLDYDLNVKLSKNHLQMTPRIKQIIDTRRDLARKLCLLIAHYGAHADQS